MMARVPFILMPWLMLWLGAVMPVKANAAPSQPEASPVAAEAARVDPETLELRDPFKRPATAPAEGSVGAIPELERFAVDQFKMVGVITGHDRLRAILMDPNGKTHFVSEKSRIGLRKGSIKQIQNDVVLVREKSINVLGKEEWVDIELRLPPEGSLGSK
jgi:Tfp pilus assembly protein PilP